jgi:Tol biopolymer transport system component
MNQTDRLERELTAWFVDAASERTPDYMTDILRQTAGTRQRPAWSFLERWLPMSVMTLGRQTLKPLPWRTIGLLALLALLLAAAAVVYVGSRPRVPAPFGPAANGLIAYARGGDIFTVDPVTGTRATIVTGPDYDRDPRWSLDGTRIAFLRLARAGHVLVVADADGSDEIVARTEPLMNADSDSIAWSPDGRWIAVAADAPQGRAIHIVDAIDGDVKALPAAPQYAGFEVFWRPSDARQLMFLGGTTPNLGLYLFSLDDSSVVEVPLPEGYRGSLRPVGWLPGGQRFAYHRSNEDFPGRTYAVDLATGAESVIGPAFGRLSNDGTRIAGFVSLGVRPSLRLCVAPVGGGPCVPIGETSQALDSDYVQWSPDDEWIIAGPVRDRLPFPRGCTQRCLSLDPDGGTQAQPSWLLDGAESWQRVAP